MDDAGLERHARGYSTSVAHIGLVSQKVDRPGSCNAGYRAVEIDSRLVVIRELRARNRLTIAQRVTAESVIAVDRLASRHLRCGRRRQRHHRPRPPPAPP